MLPETSHIALPASAQPPALVASIGDALNHVSERLARATTALLPALRDRPRSDGGWSVNQILEHIARTNEAYLPPMQELAHQLVQRRTAPREWRPTFGGRMLATSLTMRFRLPAPSSIAPGPNPRSNVIDAVIATHQSVRTLMTETAQTDWRAERMTSPLAKFVRLNFGDACVIILRHGERHAGQLEHLVQSLA